MSAPNTVKFSHFRPVDIESIITIALHVTSEVGVWMKSFKKRVKMPLLHRLNARAVATLGFSKYQI
ncbi:hypothetical protein [Candidatus Bartonella washoeensis]|uniref:Uncharacterized protein n=1 Tax=Cardidatus Bartonella washoeensis 085-0475 TaxID=1094564 RepID=J1JQV8_9HYPH|nr:hypothetical protein [Bartonella washoeensis]EJF86785.1 hypothetical protein MCW_00008 [Bartonella washoeensis 085-0475]